MVLSSLNSIMSRIKSGRCEVLGLGISNLPLCRFLAAHGASIVGRDMKPESEIVGIDELRALGVKLITGEGYMDKLGGEHPEKTVIFRAPGIRPDIAPIADAVGCGAQLTSEMELFFELSPAPIIGITGSDGKTTTTTLVGKILEKEFEGTGRRVYVGGNIGTPLLPLVGKMNENDIAVVELSSFQLMTMKRSPSRAIITNITPNHLNWHPDMAEYEWAKVNICRHSPCELAVLNAENERTNELAEKLNIPVSRFSSKNELSDGAYINDGAIFAYGERIVDIADIVIPGMHNIENYMAATLVTRGLASAESVRAVATTFTGVEHRCEFVREVGGVRFYNSSIDSTPTRTAAALSNFKTKPIVIIGGQDKSTDVAPLAKTLTERARAVVLTGSELAREKVRSALVGTELPVVEKPDFEEAVLAAAGISESGDTVILSPAFTSFDAFRNFEERGKKFKEIVNNLKR